MAFNNQQFMNIPVAILIFEDANDQISYRAYSPSQYHFNEDGSNPDHRSEQFGQFLAHLYNRVAYNELQPLNNNTNYGKLREIHTRHVEVPIINRGNICHFSTYHNPHTHYNPVHRQSPIMFDANQALNYANMQPNLVHYNCPHEFV